RRVDRPREAGPARRHPRAVEARRAAGGELARRGRGPGGGRAVIAARGLTKSFGGRRVLTRPVIDGEDGGRLGVLGPNGSGESTLLRILVGLEHADGGDVIRRRGLVDAYLPQLVPGDERDPIATVLAARPEIAELEEALTTVERRLADPALA